MQSVIKILIGLAALALILGVIATLTGGRFVSISAEAFSRGSNNLALIAIALALVSGLKKT